MASDSCGIASAFVSACRSYMGTSFHGELPLVTSHRSEVRSPDVAVDDGLRAPTFFCGTASTKDEEPLCARPPGRLSTQLCQGLKHLRAATHLQPGNLAHLHSDVIMDISTTHSIVATAAGLPRTSAHETIKARLVSAARLQIVHHKQTSRNSASSRDAQNCRRPS